MKKKLTSLLLALMLCTGLNAGALAAGTSQPPISSDQPLQVVPNMIFNDHITAQNIYTVPEGATIHVPGKHRITALRPGSNRVYADGREGSYRFTGVQDILRIELLNEHGEVTNSVLAVPEKYFADINAIPGMVKPTTEKFIDVSDTDYFAEAVSWGLNHNIVKGTTYNTFSPGDTCTQGQIITFLYRAVGSPEVTGYNPYPSLSQNDVAYAPALWGSQNGVIDDSFFPYTPCTRADAVRYLYRLAGSPAVSGSTGFTDVSAQDASAVRWALDTGVTKGKTADRFNPDEICSRAQIITFLYRALAK